MNIPNLQAIRDWCLGRFQLNDEAVTGVKGSTESTYRTGNVNLTSANIGAVSTGAILNTVEQIDANTSSENVAGALAMKSLKSDLTNSLNQINSNLRNAAVIIKEDTELEVGQIITPDVDARKYEYFVCEINWTLTPLIKKKWHDDVHDVVNATLVVCDSDIAVLRHVQFLINRNTGEITLNKWNQSNLQESGTWFISDISGQGVGLYGAF